MAIIVDPKRCNGCGICQELCPGDLMVVNAKTKKAYIRDNSDCWNCMVCVKHCPEGAITIRLPYPIALYKATLESRLEEDKIIWTLTDASGGRERYEIKRKTMRRS